MFNPKKIKVKFLAEQEPLKIQELENFFSGQTNIYIDYANVRPWSERLGWHIDLERLKDFFISFDNIKKLKIYHGTLIGDSVSESLIQHMEHSGYEVHTKPVKIMRHYIDTTSIRMSSPDLLKQFIRNCLMQKYNLETIEFLNQKFKEMNNNGILFIEDRKCNFDVEIGRDMLLDYEKNSVNTFVLWSGDSDFADPVSQLLVDGKRVILFATARRVSSELNELTKKGLRIFDIKKIKNFICWKREMISIPKMQKGT